MSEKSRIEALVRLGDWLSKAEDPIIDHAIHAAQFENPWFTGQNVRAALRAIASQYLGRDALNRFVQSYETVEEANRKSVGIIMAGNIPMVGFHDLLCVYLSGHRALLKFSERDHVLMTLLYNKLLESSSDKQQLLAVSKLSGFDAVIATGGNTSAATFRNYFRKSPHLIRSNRNAVAILSGHETDMDLRALGQDVFQYFGLGCRSVSKLYVPTDYDFSGLLETFKEFESVMTHPKYKNNYDYNFATLEINRIPYSTNGSILLKEDQTLTSRIATLHYQFYADQEELLSLLEQRAEEIQCVVGNLLSLPTEMVPFGCSQNPHLDQFADGVDTMKFLSELSS